MKNKNLNLYVFANISQYFIRLKMRLIANNIVNMFYSQRSYLFANKLPNYEKNKEKRMHS